MAERAAQRELHHAETHDADVANTGSDAGSESEPPESSAQFARGGGRTLGGSNIGSSTAAASGNAEASSTQDEEVRRAREKRFPPSKKASKLKAAWSENQQ